MTLQNKIIITKNQENIINYYKNHFNGDVIVYEGDELIIDLSREIINKSYFSSEKQRVFLIAFKSYKIEAQNALLKVFEESPSGVCFVIVSPSKNILLATICSRFIIEKYQEKEKDFMFKFSLDGFNHTKFYDFLNIYADLDKEEMLSLLKTIGKKYSKNLNSDDLKELFTCFELVKLNTKNELVLSRLGFIFLRNKI